MTNIRTAHTETRLLLFIRIICLSPIHFDIETICLNWIITMTELQYKGNDLVQKGNGAKWWKI